MSLASIALQITFFGMLLPILQALQILRDLGGHGLGNMGYIFYGALLGLVVGSTGSVFIIVRNPKLIVKYLAVLAGLTVFTALMLVVSIKSLGMSW